MSALQTIKSFFDRKLYDICPYRSEMASEGANRDVATVSFAIGENKYRLTVKQAYSAPPLGLIELTDFTNSDKVGGPIKDDTWDAVEKRLRGTKPKIELGEFVPDIAAGAGTFTDTPVVQLAPATLPLGLAPIVRYFANPGEHYMEGCALATRVHPDGSIDLTIFPHGGETYHRANVRRRSPTDIHCVWDFHEGADVIVALTERIKALEDRLAQIVRDADKPALLTQPKRARKAA